MVENWESMRLERIYKKLSALESALFLVSNHLTSFIEEAKFDKKKDKMIVDDIDLVIYGQETIEGVEELLGDVKNDVMSLNESISENKEKNDDNDDDNEDRHLPPSISDIPDKI